MVNHVCRKDEVCMRLYGKPTKRMTTDTWALSSEDTQGPIEIRSIHRQKSGHEPQNGVETKQGWRIVWLADGYL